MNDMIKKYVPYAAVICAVYLLVPLIFMADALNPFSPVAYYFIFPATAIVCSALYCSKYGMDFLFTLIAPVIYLPSMLMYNGGFKITNIILLVAYLVSGILGLFIGDIALGDKRKAKEAQEQAETERMMLKAKRRDEAIKEQLSAQTRDKSEDIDDFDYDKYLSDIDKPTATSDDDEVDAILAEVLGK